MIPIRDIHPTRTTPYVTYAIIAANIGVFLLQLSIAAAVPGGEELFARRYGVVPAFLFSAEPARWVTPFTSMFLHGGWLHILGNMWFLHVFGDNVEDTVGKGRYLLIYVGSGLAAVAAQVSISLVVGALDPGGPGDARFVPMIGASGAIAGVLAAYVLLHPRARVVTLIPIVIFIQFVEVPATFFVVVWFLYQLVGALTSIGGMGGGGIAFFAHVGGFLAGLGLVRALRKKPNATYGFEPPRPSRHRV